MDFLIHYSYITEMNDFIVEYLCSDLCLPIFAQMYMKDAGLQYLVGVGLSL